MTTSPGGNPLARIQPSSHDEDAWYVKVTDGVPQGFPAVLGLTDPPQAGSFTFPNVEVIPLGTTGKFTFAASTSADSTAYTSTSVTEMRHPLGRRKLFEGPVGLERYITEHAPRAEGQIPATGDYDMELVITAGAAGGIRELEQQHPDDVSHAYTITLETVAKAVNGLAGTPFDTKPDALAALCVQIPRELVPADASDPAGWRSRLQEQLLGLLDLTKLRDPIYGEGGKATARPGVSQIDHLPSKSVRFPKSPSESEPGTCEVVVDKPSVANTMSTQELITFRRLARTAKLADLPVVPATPAEAKPDPPGFEFSDTVITLERIKDPLWKAPKPEKSPAIEKGVLCKVASEPAYNKRTNAWLCDVHVNVLVDDELERFEATVSCSALKKVAIEVVKPTLALVTWELGSELEIDAMSDNELLMEMAGDPTGKTKMWNGATVKLHSVVVGPAAGDLAGQTFYRAEIIDVGPMGLADDLHQFMKPIAGCDMKKKG